MDPQVIAARRAGSGPGQPQWGPAPMPLPSPSRPALNSEPDRALGDSFQDRQCQQVIGPSLPLEGGRIQGSTCFIIWAKHSLLYQLPDYSADGLAMIPKV